MVRFALVVVEKFRKGTNVRTLGVFESRQRAEQIQSEKKFAGRRGQPFIIRESEIQSFVASRRTGIFKPKFKPPTQEEIKTTAERKKAQESFERQTETAKLPTEEGQVARQILKSKFGIQTKDPAFISTPTTQQQLIQSLISRPAPQIQGRDRTLSTGGVPLTFLGQPRRLELQPIQTVFPSGFTPSRPTGRQETTELKEQRLDQITPTRAGIIEPLFDPNLLPRVQETEITQGELLSLRPQAKVQRTEKLVKGLSAGGLTAFSSELVLTGVPKAVKAVPEALAFGALTFFSPITAAVVGTIVLGASIPGLQKEISQKGLVRTAASELPTVALFTGAGAAGARFKTTRVVREGEFNIKLEELISKDVDPSFTFEAKPFAIVTEGKAPQFLQRTLKGEVLTPAKLDVALKEVRGRAELAEPTTIKELRQTLGQRESRGITKEQAQQLDIFRPQIEESLFVEPGRQGLITPGKLGSKSRQLQLRESFPTVAQKGAFALAQLPVVSRPSRQLGLFPRGKKGQVGLLQEGFDIGEIFRGAGEGLRRFSEVGPELPRVARAVETPSKFGLGFFPAISTSIFEDVATDQITSQRTGQLQTLGLDQPQIQSQRQRQDPLVDVDILQGQITGQRQELLSDVDILQDQAVGLLSIQDVFQEPILDRGARRRRAATRPRRTTPSRPGLNLFGGGNIFGSPADTQGFDVIIREKGQDLEVDTKKSFPRNRAKNIGANIIDNSAAASFRIKKSSQPLDSIIDDGFFNLQNKFRSPARKSKLPPNQFIERSAFRIDSAGERAGITAKGLIARRKKALRNQFDFGFAGGVEL